ncbi:hypothetical protein AJ78_08811 [Emergomyces pasteurianus Ep9510]|uniref:DUF7924 domain-containing protein n=1 Tax=Emergomyces pasteurianus Ep9510 TaxID=1447872 RepID=A0A1J9Q156_9EURO|nr:hypothetical protein AJ78_08811 [Emergomyces pasteurianus Ep9510]
MNKASCQAKYRKGRGRQPSTFQGHIELIVQKEARPSQKYPSCEQETKPPSSCSPGKTEIQVNDHTQKRVCEFGQQPLEERRCATPTSAGEDAINRIKEHRNINVLPIQAVDLEILRRPPVSSQHSSEHKRLHPELEGSSDNLGPPSKRPRIDKNRLIEHWTRNKFMWPEKLSELDTMEHYLARPKTPSRRRTSLDTASETISREAKSRPYTNKNYDTYLETKGCFMYDHNDGIDSDCRSVCHRILSANPEVPKRTVFEEGAFESTCRRIQKKNETEVIRIIGELIVPSAESAIDLNHITFRHLIVSVNEAWDGSISLGESQQSLQNLPSLQSSQSQQFRLPRPQPDYAVSFSRQAFTETQLEKLASFVGGVGDTSFCMSTAYIFFPFMTAEVKCGNTALDIADRQNMHSMTLAVRGVVKLFRLVKREKELHRRILAFSISHDHRIVRIYTHYPVIDGEKTTYYRHSIREFSFADLDGREKWTSYKFLMGVYDDWAPSHFKRLCSAIDELPIVNFDLSQQSEPPHEPKVLHQSTPSFPESTGLSQGVEGVDIG